MTFLLTLLTFFLDGKPDAPAPSPATSGAITVPGEFEAPASVGGSLGLSQPTTSPFTSPSMMVAHPPASAQTFDVFSPALRAPQELPGLFPCDPVALVRCPSPEPPAVRHVSFMDSLSPQPAYTQTDDEQQRGVQSNHGLELYQQMSASYAVRGLGQAGSEGTAPCYHSAEAGHAECESPHHAGQYHDPHDPFPVFPHPPIPPMYPPPPLGHMPVAFAAPMPPGACPTGPGSPALSEVTLFPGAKKVQHVVRATYDVPHQTANALKPILEQSQGVMECTVEGDELTISAVGPAQSAIARFLVTVVNQPRNIVMNGQNYRIRVHDVKLNKSSCSSGQCQSKEDKCKCCGSEKPVKAIDVKITKPSCCNGECQDKCKCCGGEKPVKAIDVKITKPSCCNGECQDKCKCCSGKKQTQAAHSPKDSEGWYGKFYMSEKAREIERHLGLDSPKACTENSPPVFECPVAIECPMVKEVTDAKGNVFSFLVGFDRAESCSKATQCSGTTPCPTSVDTGNGIFSFHVGFQRSGACPKENCDWLAKVNGSPILASEVLERWGTSLVSAKNKLSPEQYEEVCKKLIQRDLGSHIERRFLAERLKATLDKNQLAKLNSLIENAFAKETGKLMQAQNVKTLDELKDELRKQNTSLDILKKQFANQRMAMEWLALQKNSPSEGTAIQVTIRATPDGILLKTSDGTQLRAQQIQLETEGIQKLQVQNGNAIFTAPKKQHTQETRGAGQAYKVYPEPAKPVKQPDVKIDQNPAAYAPYKRDGRTILPTY